MTTSENRSLNELLKLGTYQGMNDEEIETIISWRESNAYSRGNRDAISSQGMINMQEYAKRNAAMCSRIESMIESMERKAKGITGSKEVSNV